MIDSHSLDLSLEPERVALTTRAFEIVVALLVLLTTWPIILAMVLIIRLGTPGPAVFLQKRVGLGRRLFTFVKLRTFYVDARERFPELYSYSYTDKELTDLKFKVDEDPRVSPQGVWLRKSSLDELPNFLNVLTGDVALVGPRPEIPEMLPYYKGEMLKKFSVRPGITGLAQISGRGRLGFYETVAKDLEYIEKKSFWFDIKIILTTIYLVVIGHGAF